MSAVDPIFPLWDFLRQPPGRYLLAWEQRQYDAAVADIFGYHALQLGLPELDALRENRMPLRFCVSDRLRPELNVMSGHTQVAVIARFDELPFASQSLDLVVMPHVLEFADDPHQVLREVDRVLVPEGHVVITGFNPASLWGARQYLARLGATPFLPREGQFIALPRLKDWLKLLSFEVNRGRFGCYAPACRSDRWLARCAFMEKAGDRWWPVLGSVYMLTAIKRVRGMRLVGLARNWRAERRRVLQTVASRGALAGAEVSSRAPARRDEAAADRPRRAAGA
ncbi:MAG: class I SAM-dependent methyltransferase [Burkholderiaceae bacterium]|nr:class I SAM-dependent methyltransferase [Burkholderiaceae bacterium]